MMRFERGWFSDEEEEPDDDEDEEEFGKNLWHVLVSFSQTLSCFFFFF